MNYILHNPNACTVDMLYVYYSEQGWTFGSLHVKSPSAMAGERTDATHYRLVWHCRSTSIVRATKRGDNV